MADAAKGIIADMVVDGIVFDGIARLQLKARRVVSKALIQSAAGGLVEALTWWGEAALDNTDCLVPTQRIRHEIEAGLGHLRGAWLDTIEEVFSRPGTHAVAVWKPVYLSWVGDGTKDELWCPWVPAVHTLTIPGGHPAGTFDPEIWVGLGNRASALTYSAVNQATYDTGPSAGNVYWLQGGNKIKLDAVPAVGAYVFARVVPLLHMVEPGSLELTYTGQRPGREERGVVLREA